MAPPQKVKAAFRAMREIGIPEDKTKHALKKLLKLFNKKWELIEEENYRLLADTIFEDEETQAVEKEQNKKRGNDDQGEVFEEAAQIQDEPERPLKRLRLKYQNQPAPSNSQPLVLKTPKPEPGEPEVSQSQPLIGVSQPLVKNKGKQPVSSEISQRERRRPEQGSQGLQIKELTGGPAVVSKSKQANSTLIIPKDEPFTDDMVSLEPVSVLDRVPQDVPSNLSNPAGRQTKCTNQETLTNGVDKSRSTLASSNKDGTHIQGANISKQTPVIGITTSSLGEVKLLLSGLEGKDTLVQEVLKNVNDICLKKFKITDSEFSVMKVMKEFCDYVGDLSTNPDALSRDGSNKQDATVIDSNGSCLTQSNGSVSVENSNNGITEITDASNPSLFSKNANNDVARGVERVIISIEKSKIDSLPSFHYIPHNVISKTASLYFCIAQIGDKDSCPSCYGDCFTMSQSCHCAHNNGESIYSPNGVVRKEFFDLYVEMVRNPKKESLVYCKECPLERLKNEDMLDPCRGHLKRKFIKECWIMCGCSKNCGNRVVQRGINRNLQVFWTPEGKGWGLRTLEDIPKGAFVCEYVGEILTCKELHERNMKRTNDKHSYSVLLDAEWSTLSLKETEILCLDSTYYGNVARFINHRCSDANLIEIPVEVETPNHNYYRIALFSTRNINAFEELTWDYGVDPGDGDNHCKAFKCLCGSSFCRNMKRSTRSRSTSTS